MERAMVEGAECVDARAAKVAAVGGGIVGGMAAWCGFSRQSCARFGVEAVDGNCGIVGCGIAGVCVG